MKEKNQGPKFTRRDVIKLGAAGGAGFYLTTKFGSLPRLFAQAIPGLTLDPLEIPKYVTPLLVPPAMPRTGTLKVRGGKHVDYYEIAVREFTQQILPAADGYGLPTSFAPTKVWSYCSKVAPQPVPQGGTLHYPALTIESRHNTPARVKWINELVDAQGGYLPHLLPVDQTLHWANPPGGLAHRDGHGHDGTPYTGPVPLVTHVHGAHTTDDSDGYPEAWYLPAATNIDPAFATTGTYYDIFKEKSSIGADWTAGSAVFEYPNDQPATTLWYHDHALGVTRLNVYAGPAGFYIVRGGPSDVSLHARGGRATLPGPAPALGDAPGTRYYEIPIAIQDRSFNRDGSLFYPDVRAFFEGLQPEQLAIPFAPAPAAGGETSDVPPMWLPEFFGNAMVVNGYTWPYLDVEQRRYRFRLLNGCNSRFLILKFDNPDVDVWQIGAEQGFLEAPVRINDSFVTAPGNPLVAVQGALLMTLAERADLVVDFTNVPLGTTVRLVNLAPDEPFCGFDPTVVADPDTTGQVMEFRVRSAALTPDLSTPPAQLGLPPIARQRPPSVTRKLSLNELMSMSVFVPFDPAEDAFVLLKVDAAGTPVIEDGKYVRDSNGRLVEISADEEPYLPDGVIREAFGPVAAFMGTVDRSHPQADPATGAVPLAWMDTITEQPRLGTSEVWEFYNFTADAHPVHIHLVQFQVLDRQALDSGTGEPVDAPRPPEAWESGLKDTVISYPGEVTRVQATFDLPGLFVWHCHIVEHEDNEMMRPYEVVPL